MVGLALWVAATPALAADEAGDEALRVKSMEQATEFWGCLNGSDQILRAAKMQPERYQMGMRGLCLEEERRFLDGFRAYLLSIGRGSLSLADNEEITAGTVRKMVTQIADRRAALVSTYVIWFEAAADAAKQTSAAN